MGPEVSQTGLGLGRNGRTLGLFGVEKVLIQAVAGLCGELN